MCLMSIHAVREEESGRHSGLPLPRLPRIMHGVVDRFVIVLRLQVSDHLDRLPQRPPPPRPTAPPPRPPPSRVPRRCAWATVCEPANSRCTSTSNLCPVLRNRT